jgi:hypothetical protein
LRGFEDFFVNCRSMLAQSFSASLEMAKSLSLIDLGNCFVVIRFRAGLVVERKTLTQRRKLPARRAVTKNASSTDFGGSGLLPPYGRRWISRSISICNRRTDQAFLAHFLASAFLFRRSPTRINWRA